MAKNKKMDHLTRDVLAAQKAGMSYGQWKAKHPYTAHPDDDKPQLEEGMEERVCARCGNKFYASVNRTAKKYCCEECRLAHDKEKSRNKPRKAPTGKPAVCANCGADFESVRGSKYCCVNCYSEAARRQTRERNRRKKEAKANGNNVQ